MYFLALAVTAVEVVLADNSLTGTIPSEIALLKNVGKFHTTLNCIIQQYWNIAFV